MRFYKDFFLLVPYPTLLVPQYGDSLQCDNQSLRPWNRLRTYYWDDDGIASRHFMDTVDLRHKSMSVGGTLKSFN